MPVEADPRERRLLQMLQTIQTKHAPRRLNAEDPRPTWGFAINYVGMSGADDGSCETKACDTVDVSAANAIDAAAELELACQVVASGDLDRLLLVLGRLEGEPARNAARADPLDDPDLVAARVMREQEAAQRRAENNLADRNAVPLWTPGYAPDAYDDEDYDMVGAEGEEEAAEGKQPPPLTLTRESAAGGLETITLLGTITRVLRVLSGAHSPVEGAAGVPSPVSPEEDMWLLLAEVLDASCLFAVFRTYLFDIGWHFVSGHPVLYLALSELTEALAACAAHSGAVAAAVNGYSPGFVRMTKDLVAAMEIMGEVGVPEMAPTPTGPPATPPRTPLQIPASAATPASQTIVAPQATSAPQSADPSQAIVDIRFESDATPPPQPDLAVEPTPTPQLPLPNSPPQPSQSLQSTALPQANPPLQASLKPEATVATQATSAPQATSPPQTTPKPLATQPPQTFPAEQMIQAPVFTPPLQASLTPQPTAAPQASQVPQGPPLPNDSPPALEPSELQQPQGAAAVAADADSGGPEHEQTPAAPPGGAKLPEGPHSDAVATGDSSEQQQTPALLAEGAKPPAAACCAAGAAGGSSEQEPVPAGGADSPAQAYSAAAAAGDSPQQQPALAVPAEGAKPPADAHSATAMEHGNSAQHTDPVLACSLKKSEEQELQNDLPTLAEKVKQHDSPTGVMYISAPGKGKGGGAAVAGPPQPPPALVEYQVTDQGGEYMDPQAAWLADSGKPVSSGGPGAGGEGGAQSGGCFQFQAPALVISPSFSKSVTPTKPSSNKKAKKTGGGSAGKSKSKPPPGSSPPWMPPWNPPADSPLKHKTSASAPPKPWEPPGLAVSEWPALGPAWKKLAGQMPGGQAYKLAVWEGPGGQGGSVVVPPQKPVLPLGPDPGQSSVGSVPPQFSAGPGLGTPDAELEEEEYFFGARGLTAQQKQASLQEEREREAQLYTLRGMVYKVAELVRNVLGKPEEDPPETAGTAPGPTGDGPGASGKQAGGPAAGQLQRLEVGPELEGVYERALAAQQFGEVAMSSVTGDGQAVYHHHYRRQIAGEAAAGASTDTRQRRIMRELRALGKSQLPRHFGSTIALRVDEDRPFVLKAIIAAPGMTPYDSGLFLFDIYCPPEYPMGPPKVNLCTTGNGSVRFSPNAYACGKICLSLLGTWGGSGEEMRWIAGESSLLQVLVSIQTFILGAEFPYFQEPGVEGEWGSPHALERARTSDNGGYETLRVATLTWAMADQLAHPPKGFEDFVRQHFWCKKWHILGVVQGWMQHARRSDTVGHLMALATAKLLLLKELLKLSRLADLSEACPVPGETLQQARWALQLELLAAHRMMDLASMSHLSTGNRKVQRPVTLPHTPVEVPREPTDVKWSEHGSFRKFFVLERLGCPREGLMARMRLAGIDPGILDRPDEEVPLLGTWQVTGVGGARVRLGPSLDSPLCGAVDTGELVLACRPEAADMEHPLVSAGRRLRIIAPLVGWVSIWSSPPNVTHILQKVRGGLLVGGEPGSLLPNGHPDTGVGGWCANPPPAPPLPPGTPLGLGQHHPPVAPGTATQAPDTIALPHTPGAPPKGLAEPGMPSYAAAVTAGLQAGTGGAAGLGTAAQEVPVGGDAPAVEDQSAVLDSSGGAAHISAEAAVPSTHSGSVPEQGAPFPDSSVPASDSQAPVLVASQGNSQQDSFDPSPVGEAAVSKIQVSPQVAPASSASLPVAPAEVELGHGMGTGSTADAAVDSPVGKQQGGVGEPKLVHLPLPTGAVLQAMAHDGEHRVAQVLLPAVPASMSDS